MKPKTNTGGASSSQAKKNQKPYRAKAAPDGTPYPADFNRWSNADRLYWLEEHDGSPRCSLCGNTFSSDAHKACEL
jgi:hypothetical protein